MLCPSAHACGPVARTADDPEQSLSRVLTLAGLLGRQQDELAGLRDVLGQRTEHHDPLAVNDLTALASQHCQARQLQPAKEALNKAIQHQQASPYHDGTSEGSFQVERCRGMLAVLLAELGKDAEDAIMQLHAMRESLNSMYPISNMCQQEAILPFAMQQVCVMGICIQI